MAAPGFLREKDDKRKRREGEKGGGRRFNAASLGEDGITLTAGT